MAKKNNTPTEKHSETIDHEKIIATLDLEANYTSPMLFGIAPMISFKSDNCKMSFKNTQPLQCGMDVCFYPFSPEHCRELIDQISFGIERLQLRRELLNRYNTGDKFRLILVKA